MAAPKWRLRVQTSSGQNFVLGLNGEIGPDTTFGQLRSAICDEAGSLEYSQLRIKSGFPPQELSFSPEETIAAKLCNGDKLQVVFDNGGGGAIIPAQAMSTAPMKKSRGGGRSKSTPAPKPKKTGIHSIGGNSSRGSTRPTARVKGGLQGDRPKATSKATGSVLGGTASAFNNTEGAASGHAPKRGHAISPEDGLPAGTGQQAGGRKRSKLFEGAQDEGDIGAALVGAVAPGGGGGTTGRVMRRVFRSAVRREYEGAQATAREAAALGRAARFETLSTRSVAGLEIERVKVIYPKGPGHRSNYEEETEILAKPFLAATLSTLLQDDDESRENLKPYNLSRLANKRVFWSLCKHYDGDIKLGIRTLLPGRDWGFLDERTKTLSEKARRNLEAEQYLRELEEEEEKEAQDGNDNIPHDPGVKEQQSGSPGGPVGEARGEEEEGDNPVKANRGVGEEGEETAQARAAQAALARLAAGGAPAATAATPAAEEEEEEEEKEDLREICGEPWATLLWGVRVGGAAPLRSVRALAGVASAVELRRRLLVRRRPGDPEPPPPAAIAERWVDRAQGLLLDGLLREAVGGEGGGGEGGEGWCEAVVRLLGDCNVRTPEDLTLWVKAPEALLGMLSDAAERRLRRLGRGEGATSGDKPSGRGGGGSAAAGEVDEVEEEEGEEPLSRGALEGARAALRGAGGRALVAGPRGWAAALDRLQAELPWLHRWKATAAS